MRIGIDAHILVKKHKRYDPRIARYTEQLIMHMIESDKKQEHTWVLFFDSRAGNRVKKYAQPNVEIKHFPFIHYRKYLPVVYSHMLVSAFLRSAKLDVFHSPEGLIPFVYPGKMITTFHYVPKAGSDSNVFVRTFMLGARAAFAQLCRRANRIVVSNRGDKKTLVEKHGCERDQVVVVEMDDMSRVDWSKRVGQLKNVYAKVSKEKRKVYKEVRKEKKMRKKKAKKARKERAKKEKRKQAEKAKKAKKRSKKK